MADALRTRAGRNEPVVLLSASTLLEPACRVLASAHGLSITAASVHLTAGDAEAKAIAAEAHRLAVLFDLEVRIAISGESVEVRFAQPPERERDERR